MINEQNFNLNTTDKQILYLILQELRLLNSNIMSIGQISDNKAIQETIPLLDINVSEGKKSSTEGKLESRPKRKSPKKEVNK